MSSVVREQGKAALPLVADVSADGTSWRPPPPPPPPLLAAVRLMLLWPPVAPGTLRMACRCFWDENTDNYAQEVYSNVRPLSRPAVGSLWLWERRGRGWKVSVVEEGLLDVCV